jgi:hypothetical protein
MDNNYLPEKQYKVYEIVEGHTKSIEPIHGLYDTGEVFKTHDAAYEWIETMGKRQKKYTIIVEYRKP